MPFKRIKNNLVSLLATGVLIGSSGCGTVEKIIGGIAETFVPSNAPSTTSSQSGMTPSEESAAAGAVFDINSQVAANKGDYRRAQGFGLLGSLYNLDSELKARREAVAASKAAEEAARRAEEAAREEKSYQNHSNNTTYRNNDDNRKKQAIESQQSLEKRES